MPRAGLAAALPKARWLALIPTTCAASSAKPGAANSATGVALGCAPVFFLWNPWWADLVMVAYALAANLPCILAQRYNRLRFQRLLARRS